MGRWGWFVCVRSQSRPSSTHLRKGHSEWRRLGGTCRGLAGPRHSLYVRVPRKVSRRFRSSVVASHGPPLYPSVDPSDLLRGVGQSVPDAQCRHRAPNPFAGRLTNPWDIFVRIPVMVRPRGSSCIPLCNSSEGCGTICKPLPPATDVVWQFSVRHSRTLRLKPQEQSEPTHPPLRVPYAAEVRVAKRSCLVSVGTSAPARLTSRATRHEFTKQVVGPDTAHGLKCHSPNRLPVDARSPKPHFGPWQHSRAVTA